MPGMDVDVSNIFFCSNAVHASLIGCAWGLE